MKLQKEQSLRFSCIQAWSCMDWPISKPCWPQIGLSTHRSAKTHFRMNKDNVAEWKTRRPVIFDQLMSWVSELQGNTPLYSYRANSDSGSRLTHAKPLRVKGLGVYWYWCLDFAAWTLCSTSSWDTFRICPGLCSSAELIGLDGPFKCSIPLWSLQTEWPKPRDTMTMRYPYYY